MSTKDKMVYQLKITLARIRPPIWRRVVVPADLRLDRLHRIIQLSFGWSDYHLHMFDIGGAEYGSEPDSIDERKAQLNKLVSTEKARFRYDYDFGDDWEHNIIVERIIPADPAAHYPLCLAGKRACPPEDCGGPWGYALLLEALNNPEHEDHEEMLEWTDGPIDPEAFDLDEINLRLERVQT